MKVHWPHPRQRIAFVGLDTFSIEACTSSAWCDTRFFSLRGSSWSQALANAAAFTPDYCICYDPLAIPLAALQNVGGVKIGVVRQSGLSDEAQRELADLASASGGFRGYFGDGVSPLIDALPPLIDSAHCLPEPDLANWRALAMEWALPPREILATLPAVTIAARSASVEELAQLLRTHGVLLHWGDSLQADPWPMFALANGSMLLSRSLFPPSWLIEPGDDYVWAASDLTWQHSYAGLSSRHAFAAPIRIRAWQKIREAFNASDTWQRLIFDDLAGLTHLSR